MPEINVECVPVGELAVNCYIVENGGQCVIVDPGAEPEKIIRQVGARKPVAVLLTHAHYDHIGAVDAICAQYSIPLYVHQGDVEKLHNPEANVSALFSAPMTVSTKPSVVLQGGETLALAQMDIQVLHTPGHSGGCVCYVLPEGQGVLCGDTLFADGYGRTDFADGSFHLLRQSLRTLFWLTPRQISYPGHGRFGVVGRDPVEDA